MGEWGKRGESHCLGPDNHQSIWLLTDGQICSKQWFISISSAKSAAIEHCIQSLQVHHSNSRTHFLVIFSENVAALKGYWLLSLFVELRIEVYLVIADFTRSYHKWNGSNFVSKLLDLLNHRSYVWYVNIDKSLYAFIDWVMSAWKLVEAVVEEVSQPDSGINGFGDRRGGRGGGRGEFWERSVRYWWVCYEIMNVLKHWDCKSLVLPDICCNWPTQHSLNISH